MSVTSEYYLARAADSAREADAATLNNVRDRCRRSEAAWLTMAGRIAQGEAMRDTIAAAQAARPVRPA